jgi:DNA replication protein DnaC
MTDPVDFKRRFHEIVQDAERVGYFLRPEEVARRRAREAREARLDSAKPAITDQDYRAIVDDRLSDTHALSAVRRWVQHAFGEDARRREDTPRFLVLFGDRGLGKTVAAAWAAANEVARFISAGELLRLFTSRNDQDVLEMRQVYGARLLIVDDLGYERLSEEAQEMVHELVDRRQNRRFTLITTNLTEAQLRARYGERGERAMDRINHQGGLLPVEGDNLRRRWGA